MQISIMQMNDSLQRLIVLLNIKQIWRGHPGQLMTFLVRRCTERSMDCGLWTGGQMTEQLESAKLILCPPTMI